MIINKSMFSWEKGVIKISKRIISELVGTLAIFLFLISLMFVVVSIMTHSYLLCPVVFMSTAASYTAKDWYLRNTKSEDDDELEDTDD